MRVSNVFFLVAEGRVAQSFCSGKQEREFFTQPSFIFQPSLCETDKKRRRRIKQCTVGARSHAVLLLSQALMYLHHSHLANSTSVFQHEKRNGNIYIFATDVINKCDSYQQSTNPGTRQLSSEESASGGGRPDNRAETSSLPCAGRCLQHDNKRETCERSVRMNADKHFFLKLIESLIVLI